MSSLFEELRRRSVFRVAGLYVGIAWVIIEAASVILPELNAPDWLLRGLIVVSILGLPVAVVLSWVYEITDRGIRRDGEIPDAGRAARGRQMDFVVIGVLVMALGVSVYLNFASRVTDEPVRILSLLIADFENRTEDPMFSGALEQALTIGLEGAPFVTAYPRDQALDAAAKVGSSDTRAIDANVAQLIGVREGIGGVLIGVVEMAGSGYRLQARVINPYDQEELADATARASSKLDVLTAVSEIAEDLRDDLGDVTVGEKDEIVTVTSLEAAKEYATAQDHQLDGRDEQALDHYRRAVEHDPQFGRAYSGWALAAFRLGRIEESEEAWQKALALLDRMTERERYRTLGLYYLLVAKNYEKAVENYQALVERYPADSGGHNNLAVAHFYLRQFEQARREGERTLDIYPGRTIYRTNYALYAMYAGQFDIAAQQAAEVIETDPDYYKAYLPLVMAAIDALDIDAAREAYEQMSTSGERGASLAVTGLADLASFQGRLATAAEMLMEGIRTDRTTGNEHALSVKLLALAEIHAAGGEHEAAIAAIEEALTLQQSEAHLVPAARVYLELGDEQAAADIAETLGQRLQPQMRAYAHLVRGMLARHRGDVPAALDAFRAALALSDLWLARFEIGITYAGADLAAEALSEFQLCWERRGEATAIFLDDVPTMRYAATLPYWLGRSAQALGMSDDALNNFQRFLSYYSAGSVDRLVHDATRRVTVVRSD